MAADVGDKKDGVNGINITPLVLVRFSLKNGTWAMDSLN